MDVSSLIIKKTKTESRPEEEAADFPCPQLTKAGLHLDFAASFRVSLATRTTGLWKEASTENGFQHPSLQWAASLSDLSDKDKELCWAEELPGSASFDPWAWRFTSAMNSQGVK